MRPISEIIVHCTATPEGRPVTVKEIDSWHRARGWSGIGYHRVVHLDGSRENGRPIEKIGAHVEGHNTGTIGVVYVGGVEADGKTAKDTRTPAQKSALATELLDLSHRFGVVKITGHRDYANKACPSFDATSQYRDLLSKAGLAHASSASAFVPAIDALLMRGDTGAAVRAWRQRLDSWRRLIGHPFSVPEGDVFDHTIELVTIDFQKARGIVADGKVGPQTRDEMDLALAGKPPFQALPANDDLAGVIATLQGAIDAANTVLTKLRAA